MPIYEYVCGQCQKSMEIIQRFDEPAPAACAKCHAKGSLKKAVTSSAFHLKGGGWYKDLYSSKKPEQGSQSSTSAKTNDTVATAPKKKDE